MAFIMIPNLDWVNDHLFDWMALLEYSDQLERSLLAFQTDLKGSRSQGSGCLICLLAFPSSLCCSHWMQWLSERGKLLLQSAGLD